MEKKQKRVVVGFSGGVDSSVSAWLLKEQGFQVEAVFMQNWKPALEEEQYPPRSGADQPCRATEDLRLAHASAEKIGIPLRTVDFSDVYWEQVFQYFLDSYAAGCTPNPDILCNNEIKFKAFLNDAVARGGDFIATGHYVRCSNPTSGEPCKLYRGADPTKDQSYFLHGLTQAQLARSLFPLATYHKSAVRALAKRIGLPNFDKKDSTGICFIEPKRFRAFLSRYLLAKPGIIEDTAGHVLGRHRGLIFYTIGQRKGLEVGGQRGQEGAWYVVDKDIRARRLIVSHRGDPRLYKQSVQIARAHWITETPVYPLSCTGKIRYRQEDQACQVFPPDQDGRQWVRFEKPQWAVAPGQFVVFYQGEQCLGGGAVDHAP